jgi:hypothetical protein
MPEKIDLKVSLKYSIHMFPCLLKFARFGLFWHVLVLTCFGVVREQDLIARWSFDEGNGSVAADVSGGGADLLLSANAKWGMESNDTAISKHSLNMMEGDSYARAIAHDKFQANDSFSYLFWFKSNSQPDAYSQLITKKDETFSSYFVQIEPDGKSLKTIVRSFGDYYDNGSFSFALDEWNQLGFTFDGINFNTFLNGEWVGTGEIPWSIDSNNAELGVGGTADGSNLFKGWIDDLRFYGITLNPREIKESFGRGAGDFGPTPVFTVNRAIATAPVTVSLSFLNSDEVPVQVSDLNVSDFLVDGGTISNLQSSGINYTFDLDSPVKPKRITLELPAGRCRDDQNISNSYGSVVVFYGEIVTKAEDLVGWWKFDEENASAGTIPDSAGAGSTAFLLGDASLDSSDPILGSKSLLLDGADDAVKIFGLRSQLDKVYKFEDLELWWPLDGNYSDMSGNGRNATPTVNESDPWEQGRFGNAFTFTGNDYLRAQTPYYRGITGTDARTLSLWVKTTDKNWRDIAYWGSDINGQRWWLRMYRNELRMDFRNAIRRTFTKNLMMAYGIMWPRLTQLVVIAETQSGYISMVLRGSFMGSGEASLL